MFEFVIEHKVHPYTRTTQAMKWVDPRYHKYRDSQAILCDHLSNIMVENGWQPLGREPIHVAMVIHLKTVDHRVDLDNQVKAVLDAAQGIVFPFDGWVDAIHACRRKSDEDRLFMLIGHKPTGDGDDWGILFDLHDRLGDLSWWLTEPD